MFDNMIDEIDNEQEEVQGIDPKNELVFDHNANRIMDINRIRPGMVVSVVDENTSIMTIVDEVKGNVFTAKEILKSFYYMDIYLYNKISGKFEFFQTGDPEIILDHGKLSEGDIVYLAKTGTKEPAFIEDSCFQDVFGLYIVTESMSSYIDSCIEIYYDNDSEDDDDEFEEEVELEFIPLKPFFLYLKDKNDYLKEARKVFNLSEDGTINFGR